MLYTFDDADAPGAPRPAVLRDVRQPRHLPQGLERGHQAPHAVGHGRRRRCRRSTTTCGSSTTAASDYSQARDLAAEQPELLAQAAAALAHRGDEVQRAADRRPHVRAARTRRWPGGRRSSAARSQLFFPGMGRLSENSVVSIKNKSFSVTAEVDVPEGGAEGVIIAQGGRFGGWAVYVHRRPADVHLQRARHPGVHDRRRRADPGGHPPGAHGVRLRRRRARPRAATSPSTTTARRSGTGRVDATQPMVFSADETTDIGYESGTTVSPDYTARDEPVHRQDRAGCRSTSATTTTTTSSTPTSASASPWPGSDGPAVTARPGGRPSATRPVRVRRRRRPRAPGRGRSRRRRPGRGPRRRPAPARRCGPIARTVSTTSSMVAPTARAAATSRR